MRVDNHLLVSIRESMSRSLRERELAGDGRAGSFARDKAWRTQVEFVRERWRWLTLGWLVLVSPVAAAWWFLPSFGRGLVLGAFLTGATFLLWSLVVQSTGTAPVMMGEDAEQWTAHEVRKRRRTGWRLVNNLSLVAGADIDHVLVGPAGLVVLETKWSARAWNNNDMTQRVSAACDQVERNARRLELWRPVRRSGMPVRSAVVLWGGGLRRSSSDVLPIPERGRVVAGHQLQAWLESLEREAGSAPVTADSANEVWFELDRHARRRDDHDRSRQAPLLLPAQWLQRLVCFVLGACAGFYALVLSAELGGWWFFLGGVVATASGLVGHRLTHDHGRQRAAAVGLGAGAGMSTAAVLVAAVVVGAG